MRDRLASWSGGRRRGAWVLPQAGTRRARLLGGLLAAATAGVVLLALAGASLRALRLHGEAVGAAGLPLTALAIAAGLVAVGAIAWAVVDACTVVGTAAVRGLRHE